MKFNLLKVLKNLILCLCLFSTQLFILSSTASAKEATKVDFEDLRATDINLNSRIKITGPVAQEFFLKLKMAMNNNGKVNPDAASHREILSTEAFTCIRSFDGNKQRDSKDTYYCYVDIK